MHTIIHNGVLFVFHNTRQENEDMFIARCWFIAKNMHKHKQDYTHLENLSFLWVNHHCLGVEYDKEIMDQLR
jgi:hypothetical protein